MVYLVERCGDCQGDSERNSQAVGPQGPTIWDTGALKGLLFGTWGLGQDTRGRGVYP